MPGRVPQRLIGREVAERRVDGQRQFLILQHDPPVGVGGSRSGEFRAEQGVPVEEDRGEPEEGTVFLAELGDRRPGDVEVFRRFRVRRRSAGERLEQESDRRPQVVVGHAGFPHQVVDRGKRPFRRLAVKEALGQAAKAFVLVLLVDVGDPVRELVRLGGRPVGHEPEDVLGRAGGLQRFRPVDRVKDRVAPQAAVVGRGQDGREAGDGRRVRGRPADPADDPVEPEVDLDLALLVRRDHVAASPQARPFRIVLGFPVDERVQPNEVFLRVEPHEPGRRGRRGQTVGDRPEQQVVVEIVPLGRVEVGVEPALVLHRPGEFAGDPLRDADSFDRGRLFGGAFRRHLPECDLIPDSRPQLGVVRVDAGEFVQRDIASLTVGAMTAEAVRFQERLHDRLERRRGFGLHGRGGSDRAEADE